MFQNRFHIDKLIKHTEIRMMTLRLLKGWIRPMDIVSFVHKAFSKNIIWGGVAKLTEW